MIARIALPILTLVAFFAGVMPAAADPPRPPLVADLYVDMESGKPGDAMTTQLLDAMTHGTGGTWSMRRGPEKTDTPLAEFTVSAARGRLPGPVSVNGVLHQNAEDQRGWACELATPARCVYYTFKTPHPAVSVGFFLEYHGTKAWTPLDLVCINSGDDFVVMNTREHPQTPGVRVHTGDRSPGNEPKPSRAGPVIPLEDGKLYWVSMRFAQHGDSSLALFDPKTFQQIGETSTLTLTSNTPARMLIIGRCDKHPGAIPPTTIYWNDLVVDWTTARFPLLP
ncbi:MAG TPA: hypothetical protein VGO11_16485 [Chthoniobacteraceae bacterium]|jgi:hypothetical protein|nr:hypothetical protein [Chthoniobacteraceae bacterium]